MANTTFIYALKEPDTGEIRYIGKASNLRRRLANHISDRQINHRTNWIRSLIVRGLKPGLEILDEVDEEHWQQWECAYIEFFRGCGCTLVNGTPGGEGASPSVETREKLKAANSGERNPNFGKSPSVETREKLKAAKVGKKHSPEQRVKNSAAHSGENNPMFGKRHSLEARKKMSENRKHS